MDPGRIGPGRAWFSQGESVTTHYLRTFEHLAPRQKVAPPRRPRRAWIVVPAVAVLAVIALAWPRGETAPPPEAAKHAAAPRLALAPSPPPAPTADVPPVRIVEQQGPKLIEKLLAEKFGTPLPKQPAPRAPEPPTVVAAKPAPPPPPPQIADRPQLAERPPAETLPDVAPPAARVAGSKPPPLVARLTAKPEPATKPAAKSEPAAAKRRGAEKPEPKVTSKAQKKKSEDAPKAEAATTKPAPVEEEPLVVARTERVVRAEPAEPAVRAEPVEPAVRAEPVVPVAEQRPVPVIEHAVAVPVATQAAVPVGAPQAEPEPVEERIVTAARAPATRASGPSHDAVRGLLDRYAAAWRGHDVDTLRAIGQVTNDGQAAALRQYFASVGDLEVEVRVLDIRSDGDRATVRFTRLDRFRDPTGRQVSKESPPIEKSVVMTPQGLRFGSGS